MDIKDTGQTSIKLLPSFGGTASFSSLSENITFGDNHGQRMLKGINALNMSLSLNFNNLTDVDSQDLISFLQSNFYYELQNYQNNGSFDNKRINPFEFQPFYPYKKNKFNCLNFSHQKDYFNCNNVSVQLMCNTASILESVESSLGFNENIDSLVDVFGLNGGSNSSVSNADVDIKKGGYIYPSGSYVNAELNSDFIVSKSSSAAIDAKVSPTGATFSDGKISANQTPFRNSIYINNPNECYYYPYAPIHEDQNLKVRMFDFRPNQSTTLANSPKYKTNSQIDFYKKFNLYGFNPNLMNLRLTFTGRSDLEAKRILLFLESHLGYKKFGFHLQRDYGGSESVNSTPNRKSHSFFYCPEWEHSLLYKNNHSISATFIECINN